MKKLLTFLFFVFLFFLALLSKCQTLQLETEYKREATITPSLQFIWGNWQKADYPIFIDKQDSLVTIFAYPVEEYFIKFILDREITENRIIYTLLCLDEKQQKCVIEFVYFLENQRSHMYVRCPMYHTCYQIKKE